MTFQVNWRIVNALFILSAIVFILCRLPQIAISLFYHPDDHIYGSVSAPVESVIFTAKDGTRLHGWFIPSTEGPTKEALATVVHAHGNAGNMSAHWSQVSWLPERNVNLFMFDYRGFGLSDGKPSPQGLMDDTQSAIEYLRQRRDIDAQKLVLLGQSLGGNNVLAATGHCADCANTQPTSLSGIRAIILDSTFLSYSAIANDKVPGSGYLLDDRYSADRHIASVSPIPVLILHGTADQIIPWQQSEKLFAQAQQPKRLIIIPEGRHIDAFSRRHGERYRNAAIDFIDTALQSTRERQD